MKKTFVLLVAILSFSANAQSTWNLTGNAGTNPSSNFIGTTDNQPLVFKINNSEKLRLSPSGKLVFYNTNSQTWVNNLYIGGGNETTNADGNVAVGLGSMSSNTTGGGNTALGFNTLTNSTSGSGNVAIGINAMQFSVSAKDNVAIGHNSLGGVINGNYNTAVGFEALRAWGNDATSSVVGNSIFGSLLLINLNAGTYNSIFGFSSFKDLGQGNNNIAIGSNIAAGFTKADDNIFIGNNIVPYSSQPTKELNIGNWIFGNNGTIGIGQFTSQLPADGVSQDGEKYKLFVKDGIKTEKVKVDVAANNGWADYVFEKNYPLMPLKEVEQFINKNGHLPEVPTTEEAIKNGIELKEMNILLLKKIEELTLHLIDQNKELSAQKEEINTLKKQMNLSK